MIRLIRPVSVYSVNNVNHSFHCARAAFHRSLFRNGVFLLLAMPSHARRILLSIDT